jgi:hypothetical protein
VRIENNCLTNVNTGERAWLNTGEKTVWTVTVRLGDAGFAQQITLMREWFERQCFEPIRFIYDQANVEVVVSVEFPNESDAEAFAIRFDGKSCTRSSKW